MQSMFGRAGAFDNNGVVVLPWNTASVTDMSYMFHGTSSLRALNALEWQTSLVQTMDSMFREASSFNADVSTWDTQAVTSMAYMFQAASEFTSAGLTHPVDHEQRRRHAVHVRRRDALRR